MSNIEKIIEQAFILIFLASIVLLCVSVLFGGIRVGLTIVLVIVIYILIAAFFLYQICRFLLKRPSPFSKSRAGSNTMLTCKHGHNVPVWVNRGKKHMWGMYGTQSGAFCQVIVDGSTMPEVCPVCGAHWHTPDKKR